MEGISLYQNNIPLALTLDSNTMYIKSYSLIVLLLIFSSCDKFLDEKPDAKLNVPSTNHDLVAILDNHSFINPALLEIVTDDYYLTDENHQAISNVEFREAYSWSKEPTHNSFWNNSYQTIFYCNTVLDYIDRVIYEPGGLDANQIKGIAYFQRAFAYYSLVQVFCKYYTEENAQDLGLVLKLNSDINEKLQRSTLKETYDQILADMMKATELLPINDYQYPVRPNKIAAYAALSRIYLGLGNYVKAIEYTDKALGLKEETIDYNNIQESGPYPFKSYNQEVLFFATMVPTTLLLDNRATVTQSLYLSYEDNDLRKKLFFTTNPDGTIAFTGNYNSFDQGIFCGLTVAEMLLNKAEIECRQQEINNAKNTLKELLDKRYASLPNIPSKQSELLDYILKERRKELFFRGVRWSDLRRYAKEGREVTLIREIDGKKLIMSSTDVGDFCYKIPLQALERGNLKQNP